MPAQLPGLFIFKPTCTGLTVCRAPLKLSSREPTPPQPAAPPCPQGARYGMVSMCTGSGMGAAAVFESGDSSGSFSSGSTSSASLGSVASADAS